MAGAWINQDCLDSSETAGVLRYRAEMGALRGHLFSLAELRKRVLPTHDDLKSLCIAVIVSDACRRVEDLRRALRPASDFYNDMGGVVFLNTTHFTWSAGESRRVMAEVREILAEAREFLVVWHVQEGRGDEHTEETYWSAYERSYAELNAER